MNAEKLIELYDRVADAPDAIPRLRRFVLDLAVRGKLVEQDPGDEPADTLLRLIDAHVSQLVVCGGMKPPTSLPPVVQDEVCFSTPAGWAWSRLGRIAACLDYMRQPVNSAAREARIEGKRQSELYPYFGATQQQGWIDGYIFDEELVLLGEDGVPFFDHFRPKAYVISGKTWVNNHAHVFRGILILPMYLAHYLNVFDYSGRVVGATRSKLNQSRAIDIPVAVPPLQEQRRIVARVDELMTLLDRLEAARGAREATRDRFTTASLTRLTAPDPDTRAADTQSTLDALPALTTHTGQIKQFRETILELAARGRLVPQDAGEPAPKIDHEVSPPKGHGKLELELPPNWRWAMVSDVASCRLGKMLDKSKNKGQLYPYLRNTNVHWFQVRTDDLKEIALSSVEVSEYLLENGDVLICEGGHGIARTAVWRGELRPMTFQKALHRVRPGQLLSPDFFAYCCFVYFISGVTQAYFTGVGIPHFTGKALSQMAFPLPPLAEQHRIVAKVDELMALCDRLEAALTTADTTRARLLEALLHEALAPAMDEVA